MHARVFTRASSGNVLDHTRALGVVGQQPRLDQIQGPAQEPCECIVCHCVTVRVYKNSKIYVHFTYASGGNVLDHTRAVGVVGQQLRLDDVEERVEVIIDRVRVGGLMHHLESKKRKGVE